MRTTKQAAKERAEQERLARQARQAELAKWLTANCSTVSEAVARCTAATLAAPGFGIDSVEMLRTLALFGDRGEWPSSIDVATRLAIIKAFKDEEMQFFLATIFSPKYTVDGK